MRLRNEIKLQSATGSIKFQNHLLNSDCSMIFISITKAKKKVGKRGQDDSPTTGTKVTSFLSRKISAMKNKLQWSNFRKTK